MKRILKNTMIAAMAITAFASCTKPTSVIWTEGATDPQTGKATHRFTVLNPPSGTDWCIWFNQFRATGSETESSQGKLEYVRGSLYRLVPTVASKDSLVIEFVTSPLRKHALAPEAFTLDIKGKKPSYIDFKHVFQPFEEVERFTYSKVALGVEDMIPQLKSVVKAEGSTVIGEVKPEIIGGHAPGWYRIVLDGAAKVQANDEDGAFYAQVTIDNLKRNAGGNTIPNMTIEDWPDLQYRGFMLDIARNFTGKDGILKILDVLAHYKASVLHLHFADDEGWRIEMEGLPELTSFGAFHALPELNAEGKYVEVKALMPTYSGGFDGALSNTANGFLSKNDFIEILRYAAAKHITVIPEFDTPGHSRATIKAMDMYCDRTGDETYRLSEPDDASVYNTAQDYDDNTLNVALPSTYAFIGRVFDTLIAYYKEAGVPVKELHVGGDEVPKGAWTGSPACRKLMEENGWDDIKMLDAYYIQNVMDLAEARGIKIDGWQEMGMNLPEDIFERLTKNAGMVNYWSTTGVKRELGYNFANNGLDVVLSNESNAYLDMAYSPAKNERGHTWAGIVDERTSFSILPYAIYKSVRFNDNGTPKDLTEAGKGLEGITAEGRKHIRGIQGQLWTETIRNFGHVGYYVFPKSVGLYERGWNASPVWESSTAGDDAAFTEDFNRFYTIIVEREVPYYESVGIGFRKPTARQK